MVRIRVFEERVRTDYLARRMPGFTHSYVGEEAVATGGCAAAFGRGGCGVRSRSPNWIALHQMAMAEMKRNSAAAMTATRS